MTVDEIPGWFPKQNQDYLAKLIEDFDVETVIEIGSFVGKSAVFFAQQPSVKKVECVDQFVLWDEGRENGDASQFGEKFDDKFLENINASGFGDKITFYPTTSEEASNLPFRAELIYIDAAHDYKNVLQDIMLWKGKARKIVCGDDYDENWPGVKQAVDEVFGDRVQVSGNLWYVIL